MYHFDGHMIKTTVRYHGVVYHRNVQIGGGRVGTHRGEGWKGGGKEDGIPTSKLR